MRHPVTAFDLTSILEKERLTCSSRNLYCENSIQVYICAKTTSSTRMKKSRFSVLKCPLYCFRIEKRYIHCIHFPLSFSVRNILSRGRQILQHVSICRKISFWSVQLAYLSGPRKVYWELEQKETLVSFAQISSSMYNELKNCLLILRKLYMY